MSQRILVGNLPPDVTEEEIEQVARDGGAKAPHVTLNREGDPDKVGAVVELPNLDRAGADAIASRINGSRYKDRSLTAYVPLFM
jgi:RNA recognition motif-containing protein